MQAINIDMYTVTHYDNQVPYNIHKAAYDYLQIVKWHSRYRHVPNASIDPSEATTDLLPYVTKKTVYRSRVVLTDAPVRDLFNCINEMFNNKFELNGAPLGYVNFDNVPETEYDDYQAEADLAGSMVFVEAEPYETVKRTRIPYRDALLGDGYYTIVFVANLEWNPVWHAETFFFEDDNEDIGNAFKFLTNMPGRVTLYDSRVLHNSKPTSVFANELAQRIVFRVKLKEGETLV